MKKPLVLIVDDEPHFLYLTKAALEGDEMDIACALSGEECLGLVAKAAPDVILVDLMMPKMSGSEVCERLKSSPGTEGIRIIYYSVLPESEISSIVKKTRADGYIEKGLHVDSLKECVLKMLSKA